MSNFDQWQENRELLGCAFDLGQLKEGARSTGGTGGCPLPDLGSSPQRSSLFLAPHGSFAQQGWRAAQGRGVEGSVTIVFEVGALQKLCLQT